EFVVRDKDSFTSQQDVLDYFEQYKQAQSKDTYGGKTPEETLGLFVDALKKGDTTLASKYFVLDKQKEMGDNFKKGLKNGSIDLLLSVLNKEKIASKLSENNYRFTTVDANGVAEFNFDLILNELTNIWKIESL
ncbi:MAG: hypothetical protein AAB679_02065, partial [Patescibacteria group bacterium]